MHEALSTRNSGDATSRAAETAPINNPPTRTPMRKTEHISRQANPTVKSLGIKMEEER